MKSLITKFNLTPLPMILFAIVLASFTFTTSTYGQGCPCEYRGLEGVVERPDCAVECRIDLACLQGQSSQVCITATCGPVDESKEGYLFQITGRTDGTHICADLHSVTTPVLLGGLSPHSMLLTDLSTEEFLLCRDELLDVCDIL